MEPIVMSIIAVLSVVMGVFTGRIMVRCYMTDRLTDSYFMGYLTVISLMVGIHVLPVSTIRYDSDRPNEYITQTNVVRTLDNISFDLADEPLHTSTITRDEAKYVNRPFKVYRKFYKNGYGEDVYTVEYEFKNKKGTN
jgi:hypothetical protein